MSPQVGGRRRERLLDQAEKPGAVLPSWIPALALLPLSEPQFPSYLLLTLSKLKGSVRLWDPYGLMQMGGRAIQRVRPGPEGCLLPLPQLGLPGSQVFPQPPTPRGSGSLSVQILLPSQPRLQEVEESP